MTEQQESDISTRIEILQYNYRPIDTSFMKYIERIDLSNYLQALKKGCVSRNDIEWQQYHFDDLIKNGGEDFNRLGHMRLQLCKDCGVPIYLSFPKICNL